MSYEWEKGIPLTLILSRKGRGEKRIRELEKEWAGDS
jgi:hypothetical protein